ncbi:MAG: DUF262 domain-containing protein [Marinifilaceae bacterium]
MRITLNGDIINAFKNDSVIFEKIKVLESKVYKTLEDLEKDLKVVLPGDQDSIIKKVLDDIKLIDDSDTNPENGTIYPYDPSEADIDIREEPQTVYELAIRKWDKNKLVLDPNFQRNFVWKPDQQSLFIESVLLNFPLPPFYINKSKKGQYIIVDGRQRITTLRSYLKGDFKLEELRALPQLNGKYFDELEGDLQSKIEDKKLNVYLIQPSVPMEMVYDIFNRINTGGTQLQRQEIRNCIYMGRATKLLGELAKSQEFVRAIDGGVSSLRKKDQEAVLRCISFWIFDFKEDYQGSMNDFVEKAMVKINNDFTPNDILDLEKKFKRIMRKTYSFFGSTNFRIPTNRTRGRINLAVLESVSYFFAQKDDAWLDNNKRKVKENYNLLLNDVDYEDAVRFSTGDPKRVRTRFNKVMEVLGGDAL